MAEYLIITGLSGAGRSTAADTLEDHGWLVIDNLPPTLIPTVGELVARPGSQKEKVVLVSGRGGAEYVDELTAAIDQLRQAGNHVGVLFLQASDEVLVRRFKGTRRRHPVAAASVGEGIAREREVLEVIKRQADVVVDTSDLNVHQLRDRVVALFERSGSAPGMQTSVVSFGYKHGVPLEADLVIDCRFLPNPHWVEELRPHTGLDEPVREYVMAQPETKEFLARLDALLELVLPGYAKEGKAYLTLAVGCTGGRHRSVALAGEIAAAMQAHGFEPTVHHRDLYR
ncbi:MAG: RNase adapter RapZ [Actinomycetota bacterium]|nr:RNase adapter RapZ [Actinomycetota bacterium]MDQ3575074.1 RNase adapter RapZ [Actinomycetota bacterium]